MPKAQELIRRPPLAFPAQKGKRGGGEWVKKRDSSWRGILLKRGTADVKISEKRCLGYDRDGKNAA